MVLQNLVQFGSYLQKHCPQPVSASTSNGNGVAAVMGRASSQTSFKSRDPEIR